MSRQATSGVLAEPSSSEDDTRRFTDVLFETMSPRSRPRELVALQVRLMKQLLTDGPIAPQHVAAAAGRPASEGAALLSMAVEMGIAELDEDANLVGMVVTHRPTRHAISTSGASAYAWCAIDTLFLPAVLDSPLRVASTCPETGDAISLDVAQTQITALSPAGVYVSLVAPGLTEGVERCGTGMAGLTTAAGTFCGNSNFFASRTAASAWHVRHPGALVLPAVEAFDLVAKVWADPYRDASGMPPLR